MDFLYEKKQRLEDYLKELGSVVIAFSSGVDSTFLLKTAHDLLGEKAIAVTAKSSLFPLRELNESIAFCKMEGIRHIILDFDEFSVEGFSQNPPNRCYLCKRELFSKFLKTAKEEGIKYVAEGSNTDDTGDYRPGLIAVSELGIKSPLRAAGLSKSEIRKLSEEIGLSTWNKPSYACLASRFVYGQNITKEKLYMVERSEQYLRDLGFHDVRVRIDGNTARIEIACTEFQEIIKPDILKPLNEYLHKLGFLYVTLDLGGYKTGSMNRPLKQV